MSYDQSEIDYFMSLAFQEAQKAFDEDEVPIGAVIVKDNKIIGRGHNQKEHSKIATAHAEKIAIEQANFYLGDWRLNGCALFTTLEPCVMCCGAIIQSRISELYFGALDPKFGAVRSLYHLLEDSRANHFVLVHSQVQADRSAVLMQSFFKKLRGH